MSNKLLPFILASKKCPIFIYKQYTHINLTNNSNISKCYRGFIIQEYLEACIMWDLTNADLGLYDLESKILGAVVVLRCVQFEN